MSTTTPPLLSPTLSFKPHHHPTPSLPSTKAQTFIRPQLRRNLIVGLFSPKEVSRISLVKRFAVNDDGGAGGVVDWDEAEKEARGTSTMPERFRYLAKEAPDPPVRWPWFLGQFIISFSLCFCVWLSRKCRKMGKGNAKWGAKLNLIYVICWFPIFHPLAE